MAEKVDDKETSSLWAKKRRAQDRKANARVSKQKLALVLLLSVAVARGIFKIPLTKIGKFSLTSMLVATILSLKPAPPRLNKHLYELYKHYPIVGGIEWITHALFECPIQQQIDEGTKSNFTATELCLLGGTRDLAIYDKRDIEYVLRDNWKNYTKNCEGALGFTDFFGEMLGRGIFAIDWDDGEWQAHRKTASYMFSNSALTTKMESSFNKHGKMLVHLLEGKAASKVSFNIQDAMQALTFDSIFDIAFGNEPGALEASLARNERIDFLVRFDRLQQNMTNRFLMPGSLWQFLRTFGLSFEAVIETDAKALRAYVKRIVENRKNETGIATRGDLLSLYIETANKNPDKAHLKDDDYLSDMVLNFAIAGRDTTSCTLTNLILELFKEQEEARKLNKPSVADHMRDEFARVVGASKGVAMDHIKDLRYCSAVFNEVLRLHCPVAIDGRMCREDDCLPTGVKVARATFVWIPNVAIGRDPSRWDKPSEFLPERWLVETDPNDPVKRVDEYLHPVFWGGPRLCIGKDAARLEVLCIAKAFLEQYDFELSAENDSRIAPAPVQFYEKGLWGKVVPRHAQA